MFEIDQIAGRAKLVALANPAGSVDGFQLLRRQQFGKAVALEPEIFRCRRRRLEAGSQEGWLAHARGQVLDVGIEQ